MSKQARESIGRENEADSTLKPAESNAIPHLLSVISVT